MPANITGEFIIASAPASGGENFHAVDPATGAQIEPAFHSSNAADVARACKLAAEAFEQYRRTGLEERAAFLDTVADRIAAIGDVLIERGIAETGLPRARLEGERQRTLNQLRLFARVVRQGDWLGVRVDPAQPERVPRRPDLRLRKLPLGPVAVFGASNFPLAFSVAGGDTASALAAGCPVVVKGHPAHPGVSELIGRAIAGAVIDCGLPGGVFSLLAGTAHELGRELVANPLIKAVGFTGSRRAGLALAAVAAARPEPIPVYAEMSSVNPVFLLPDALADAEAVARGFVGSLTLGAGQFCTNPGLLFAIDDAAVDRFVAAASAALAASATQTMLTPDIHSAYERSIARLDATDGVERCAQGPVAAGMHQARAAIFVTDSQTFVRTPELADEVFGAAAIVVRATDADTLVALAERLEGQLTATLHLGDADLPLAARLVSTLESKAGRLIVNGWPTGVEVAHAMVHGGPFPATSDSRTTSVGSLAIERFLRPVCYQDFPEALLPAVLCDSATGIERLIDGVRVPAGSTPAA